MSTVAITLAISSVAPVEAQQQKRWCCMGPREKNRAAPSAIFFPKRPKAILRHEEGEGRFLSAAPCLLLAATRK
jgi:hypothetical protein